MTLNRLRAWWRFWFHPLPPLQEHDFYISLRDDDKSWQEARREQAEKDHQRVLAWQRGERID